jgi:hypothetical protein
VLVCNWLHSVGQNHFYVFIQGSCFIQSLHFCFVLQEDSVWISRQLNSVPLQPSGRRVTPSGRSTVQSIIRPDDENFPFGPSSVSRSFELLQLAFIWTSQQHVQTPLSVRSAMGSLSKTQIWEDSCNHPDDVC